MPDESKGRSSQRKLRMRTGFISVVRLIAAAFVVYTLVFLAFAGILIDPARSMLGPLASQEAARQLDSRYGLDQPLPIRYLKTLGAFARGDFGDSIYFREKISTLIAGNLATTLIRFLIALCLGTILATFVTPIAVGSRARWPLYGLAALTSVPPFVTATTCLVICSAVFMVTPSSSRWLYEVITIILGAGYAASAVATYLFTQIDYERYPTRSSEFLLMIRAPPSAIMEIIMRSALPGVLAVAANAATGVLTVTTFAEYVFRVPGFSVLFVESCQRADIAVVAAGTLALALILLLLQNVADSWSIWLDKRLEARAVTGSV